MSVPFKLPFFGATLQAEIQPSDVRGALDDLSARLWTSKKAMFGLLQTFSNGFGCAFDNEELTESDVDEFRRSYGEWRGEANDFDLRLQMLIEYETLTDALFHHTHLALLDNLREAQAQPAAAHSYSDKQTEPHNQHLQAPWALALGDYREASDMARGAANDDETTVAIADSASAFKRLVRTRVPDLTALREKVRIVRAELGQVSPDCMTQLLADIDRLN